jgi:hypothetical protein
MKKVHYFLSSSSIDINHPIQSTNISQKLCLSLASHAATSTIFPASCALIQTRPTTPQSNVSCRSWAMAALLLRTQTSLRTQGAAWVAKLRMRML